MGGVGAVDDVVGVDLVGDPQRDAQVGVGPDVVVDDAARALGGQHEVDAERSAPLGDVDDAGDELGHLLLQEGELVEDDEQVGGRGGEVLALEVDEVLGAVLAQDLLPAAQLGVERDERPVGEVGVEVGEEADGVGELDAVLERRAALVVDEHERELVGGVRRREGGDVALQQLALARAGGAGGQAVGAVAPQVDLDHARPDRRRAGRRGRCRIGGPATAAAPRPSRARASRAGRAAGPGGARRR